MKRLKLRTKLTSTSGTNQYVENNQYKNCSKIIQSWKKWEKQNHIKNEYYQELYKKLIYEKIVNGETWVCIEHKG